MNTVNYERARVYAHKVAGEDYLDIVHDAYVKWYDKTGHDLFDEPQGLVVHVVKRTIQNHKSGNYFKTNGVKYKKVTTNVLTDTDGEVDDRLMTFDDPFQIISYEDVTNLIKDSLTPQKMIIFDFMLAGYKISDIAIILGKSFHNIKWHVESIRKYYNNLN